MYLNGGSITTVGRYIKIFQMANILMQCVVTTIYTAHWVSHHATLQQFFLSQDSQDFERLHRQTQRHWKGYSIKSHLDWKNLEIPELEDVPAEKDIWATSATWLTDLMSLYFSDPLLFFCFGDFYFFYHLIWSLLSSLPSSSALPPLVFSLFFVFLFYNLITSRF